MFQHLLKEENKIPNVDIIEVPKGTLESDIDRIFDFIKNVGIDIKNKKLKSDFKFRNKIEDLGLRVNEGNLNWSSLVWYKDARYKTVNYKKLLPVSKYVKQLKFESLNEKNVLDGIDIVWFNLGSMKLIEQFINILEKKYGKIIVPGRMEIMLDFNKSKKIGLRINETLINYGFVDTYRNTIYNQINVEDLKNFFPSKSKYVKQLNFEAVEPGQQVREVTKWKTYPYDVTVRKTGGKLYIYDYERLSFEDRRKIETSTGVKLKKLLEEYKVEAFNFNSYNWENWDDEVAKTFINFIKKDFKGVNLDLTNFNKNFGIGDVEDNEEDDE